MNDAESTASSSQAQAKAAEMGFSVADTDLGTLYAECFVPVLVQSSSGLGRSPGPSRDSRLQGCESCDSPLPSPLPRGQFGVQQDYTLANYHLERGAEDTENCSGLEICLRKLSSTSKSISVFQDVSHVSLRGRRQQGAFPAGCLQAQREEWIPDGPEHDVKLLLSFLGHCGFARPC